MKKQGVRTVGTTARTSEEIEGARSVRTGRRSERGKGKDRESREGQSLLGKPTL